MTVDEWAEAASLMIKAWPNQSLEDETLGLYFEELNSYEGSLVVAGVRESVLMLDFPPTLHQLKETVKRLKVDALLTEEQTRRDSQALRLTSGVGLDIATMMGVNDSPLVRLLGEVVRICLDKQQPEKLRLAVEIDFKKIVGTYNLAYPDQIEFCRNDLQNYIASVKMMDAPVERLEEGFGSQEPFEDIGESDDFG